MGKQVGMAALALLLLTGCRVDRIRHGDGKDVQIETPFGGMSVKTGGQNVQAQTGLALFPGATADRHDGDEHGAADVNMNFGSFHLGVKAASYTTTASPEQVTGFYRAQLAQYGTVIACRGKQPVGQPEVTGQGLRCDEGSNARVGGGDSRALELKTGSRAHQRVVGISPQGSGTKFSLVLLDLPVSAEAGQDDRQ